MKTVAFKTLGCKVNQYETQLLREQFMQAGFKETTACADVYVINTCTVTRKSDSESRRLIRTARRESPDSKIIVTGCYTELDKNEIEKITDNLLVVRNSEKDKILQYLPDFKQSGAPDTISRFEGRTKAFVKVQDGCDNFCSYCKVPLVRGRSRSRRPEGVILEIKNLISNGYKEIILTGICLGDWGRDFGLGLSWLLEEIKKGIDGEYRIRLSSIEPWYVTLALLETIAGSNKICRHLHIPMQSGDDEILKKMNRRFEAKEFEALINRLRSFIPGVAFTTDILVGFPTEGEKEFNNTLKLVKAAQPSRAHIFPFSMRKGTKASLLAGDEVPARLVRERIRTLKSVTDKLAIEYKRRL